MKVKISFTIDVDPDEWIANYDCDKKDVRADVNDYVYHGTYAQFADMGYLTKDQYNYKTE